MNWELSDVAVIEGDTVDETNIAEITKTSASAVPLYKAAVTDIPEVNKAT